jgi:hypothetical protein
VAYYLFNFSKKGAAKGKTLRDEAGALLQAGLWGIGEKTPHREALSEGDHVLIYVGAPEKAFVGAADLSSGVHVWTPEEEDRYPHKGTFEEGVMLEKATLWPHPVPIKTVLPSLSLYETNPKASSVRESFGSQKVTIKPSWRQLQGRVRRLLDPLRRSRTMPRPNCL